MDWDHDHVFSVAGKMFAVITLSGPKQGTLGFMVEDEPFLALADQPGIKPWGVYA